MITCNTLVDKTYSDVPLSYLEEEHFTLSYNLRENFWASFHDYFPDYSVNLRNHRVLHFRDNKLYILGEGEAGVYFGIPYSCYITPVYVNILGTELRDILYKDFTLKYIGWTTDV